MKRLFISDRFLMLPQSRGWRAFEWQTIEQLLNTLQCAFPKGTEFEVILDSADLLSFEIESGLAAKREVETRALEERPELGQLGMGWAWEAPRKSGEGWRVRVWHETQPFSAVLAELLAVRNSQTLGRVLPWALAVPEVERGRAALVAAQLPGCVLIWGTSPDGELHRAKIEIPGPTGDWLAELDAAIERVGLARTARPCLPAVVRVHKFTDAPISTELADFWQKLAAANRVQMTAVSPRGPWDTRNLAGGRSLTRKAGGRRIRNVLRGFQIAAVLTLACVGASGWTHVRTAERTKRQLEQRLALAEARSGSIRRMEAEIVQLDDLYGKDVGWVGGVPRVLLPELDDLFPRQFSLNLVDWSQDGRLSLEAERWGAAEKSEAAKIDETTRSRLTRVFSGRTVGSVVSGFDAGLSRYSVAMGGVR